MMAQLACCEGMAGRRVKNDNQGASRVPIALLSTEIGKLTLELANPQRQIVIRVVDRVNDPQASFDEPIRETR